MNVSPMLILLEDVKLRRRRNTLPWIESGRRWPSSRRSRDVSAKDWVRKIAASGWFAARPSGTESIYKIYAEASRTEII